MGKYFGTDGVRGVANKELTPELAFKLGRIGGYLLSKNSECKKMILGRDTRLSGEMLESALTAGLLSVGVEVIRLGVIPTPGVAYMTRALKANGGVMISASHNPFPDNGIKFFGPDGFKLPDNVEEEFERLLDSDDLLPRPISGEIGVISDYLEGNQKYIKFLKNTIKHSFDGLKIVLDCANGAASSIATRIFADLGANVTTIAANPNGVNINDGVGSTHIELLQKTVLEKSADIGLAFDGDADRLIAVNEKGEVVDGDFILYICGKMLQNQERLKHNAIVSTVMSNFGFKKAVKEQNIENFETSVGDKYVLEKMVEGGYNLGGEQSGHIIFLDHNTTGDGLLTSLQLVEALVSSEKKLSELCSGMKKFPQVLVNFRTTDKESWKTNFATQNAIKEGEEILGDSGRILVRPSGTEPLIRVMVEGPELAVIEKIAQDIVDTLN